MSSANEVNAVEIAIYICTTNNFKKEVIKVSGASLSELRDFKKEWNRTVEDYVSAFFMINPMSEDTQVKVAGIVFSLAFRMLTWTEYHVRIFDFHHDFCLSLLTKDMFSKKGTIKYKRTAEQLENGRLSVEQKFRLASWHCLKDMSNCLFSQLDEENKKFYIENVYDYIPEIVQFWAYYIMGDIQTLMNKKSSSEEAILIGRPGKREFIDNPEALSQSSRPFSEEDIKCMNGKNMKGELKNILQFKLQNAILSGSKTAVKHCIDEILEKVRMKDFLSDALIEFAIQRMELTSDLMGESKTSKIEFRKYVNDWVAFRCPKFTKNEVWIPNHFMIDIFYYIISRMSIDEKKRIASKLKDAIELNFKVRTSHYKQLFCHFMCWPYRDSLMEFVNLCWEYVPFEYYATFLFTIFDRIEPSPGSLHYGENTAFDYEGFFMELWQTSPSNFKRYFFEDRAKEESFQLKDKTWVFNVGKTLLLKMIEKENFVVMKSYIIRVILDHAEPKERDNFIFSGEGRLACEVLMGKHNYFLDELIKQCIGSAEAIEKFKTKLKLVERCLELIKDGKFLEAESEVTSLKLTLGENFDVKEEVICSLEGLKLLRQFGFENNDNFDSFIKWSKITAFNKLIHLGSRLLNNEGKSVCLSISTHRPEYVDRFLNLCYSLEETSPENIKEKIRKFKEDLFSRHGISHCRFLMFEDVSNTKAVISMEERLNLVDQFLNWCFNDIKEKEKNKKCRKFKKDLLRHENGDFHYKFIKSCRFNDAVLFFKWADFDLEDIEMEKGYKLFYCSRTANLLVKAMDTNNDPASKDRNEKFIDGLLRWCLVDRESVNLFETRYPVYSNDAFVLKIIKDLNCKFKL